MIFGRKLLSSLSVSGILLSQVPRHTQKSSGNIENIQLRFGSNRRDPFLTVHHCTTAMSSDQSNCN